MWVGSKGLLKSRAFLLLRMYSYLDPADTGLLVQLCPSNNLRMPILSLGPTYTAVHHAGPYLVPRPYLHSCAPRRSLKSMLKWKKAVEREISTLLTMANAWLWQMHDDVRGQSLPI